MKKSKALLLIIYTTILIYLGYRAYYAWGTSLITAYLSLISIWVAGVVALSRIIDWIFHENQLCKKEKGKLQIINIIPHENKKDGACEIEIQVKNNRDSNVLVNRVNFKVLDILPPDGKKLQTLGYLDYSHAYGLDISHLKRIGDTIDCNITQTVTPDDIDRFKVVLIAKDLGTGEFRKWKLQPKLLTDYGEEIGDPIDVWLPYVLWPRSFEEEMNKKLDSL